MCRLFHLLHKHLCQRHKCHSWNPAPLSASFRLGTAAARIERSAQAPLDLVIPGPFLVSAGAVACPADAVSVPKEPAVLGVAPAVALAALTLAICSGVRVRHSDGE